MQPEAGSVALPSAALLRSCKSRQRSGLAIPVLLALPKGSTATAIAASWPTGLDGIACSMGVLPAAAAAASPPSSTAETAPAHTSVKQTVSAVLQRLSALPVAPAAATATASAVATSVVAASGTVVAPGTPVVIPSVLESLTVPAPAWLTGGAEAGERAGALRRLLPRPEREALLIDERQQLEAVLDFLYQVRRKNYVSLTVR